MEEFSGSQPAEVHNLGISYILSSMFVYFLKLNLIDTSKEEEKKDGRYSIYSKLKEKKWRGKRDTKSLRI